MQQIAMEKLSAADANAVLSSVERISAASDLDSFAQLAASSVRALVSGDVCSYVEVNPSNGRQINVPDPIDFSFPEGTHELLAANIHEHPVASWHQRTGRGDARAISDFLGPEEFRRSVLYDVFEAINAKDQIAIALGLRGSAVIGVALNRDRVGFSKRDRNVLQLLRPHLVTAYGNVEARMHLDTLAKVNEEAGHAVIILGNDGRPVFATKRALRLVRQYVGRGRAGGLPSPLRSWVASQKDPDQRQSGYETFMAEDDEAELVVRFLPAGESQPKDVLLLSERRQSVTPERIRSLGLTTRESEVVALVVLGKSNSEIAETLDVRPSTIKKHMEHIYSRLGISTRAELTARAIEAAR